jgi:8-oxo-dGTP pyrophosphatase MutT (NUDIX family)
VSALAERYRKILAQRPRKTIAHGNLVPAAVLLLLYEKEAKPYILLTKRTETVANHKGQISLPGGSREIQDSTLTDTALREAFEEVGVRSEDVDVLGLLDDFPTATSRFVITPVVGYLHYPPDIVVNPREVEEIIEIPLAFFQDVSEAQVVFEDNGSPKPYPEYSYGDYYIWGATARILEQFSALQHSTE